MVAPFTGAWIETALQGSQHLRMLVAPFTGAWIETFAHPLTCHGLAWSPPSRGRGLKKGNKYMGYQREHAAVFISRPLNPIVLYID